MTQKTMHLSYSRLNSLHHVLLSTLPPFHLNLLSYFHISVNIPSYSRVSTSYISTTSRLYTKATG